MKCIVGVIALYMLLRQTDGQTNRHYKHLNEMITRNRETFHREIVKQRLAILESMDELQSLKNSCSKCNTGAGNPSQNMVSTTVQSRKTSDFVSIMKKAFTAEKKELRLYKKQLNETLYKNQEEFTEKIDVLSASVLDILGEMTDMKRKLSACDSNMVDVKRDMHNEQKKTKIIEEKLARLETTCCSKPVKTVVLQWGCYHWTREDRRIIKYSSESYVCGSKGYTMTFGRNANYPGCSMCFCCKPVRTTKV